MFCIFCYPENPRAPLSREHIVPAAIGGSLVIDTVCKHCNDRLGAEVDVLLVDNFLMQMIRLGLRIPDSSGKIRSPLSDGAVVGTDMIGSFHQPRAIGKGDVSIRPRVEERINAAGNVEKHVVASAEEFPRILEQLRTRAARDGRQIRVTETPPVRVQNPVVRKTGAAPLASFALPLLKIAFEYAAHVLGPTYVKTATAAQIRNVLLGTTPSEAQLTYSLAPVGTVLLSGSWPSYFHALRLVRSTDDIVCNFRLFNVLEASCVVARAGEYRAFTGSAISLIDPLARRTFTATGETIVDSIDARIALTRTADTVRMATFYEGVETTVTTMELAAAN